ncbi:hypothetical protein THAOC_18361, partial [Thalassiosira oceanica]
MQRQEAPPDRPRRPLVQMDVQQAGRADGDGADEVGLSVRVREHIPQFVARGAMHGADDGEQEPRPSRERNPGHPVRCLLAAHEPVHAPHRPKHQRADQELAHGQEPALQRVHEIAEGEAPTLANLPDCDDSDEEAEEDDDDEDDSVCSDDGGLEWDDEPGTTSLAEAEKTKRRREKADRKFIHRVVCHLMRADPGDDKAFEDVALPAAY